MYLWLIYTFVFILDFSLELEQEETDYQQTTVQVKS
jgi:hypothetical protein